MLRTGVASAAPCGLERASPSRSLVPIIGSSPGLDRGYSLILHFFIQQTFLKKTVYHGNCQPATKVESHFGPSVSRYRQFAAGSHL